MNPVMKMIILQTIVFFVKVYHLWLLFHLTHVSHTACARKPIYLVC